MHAMFTAPTALVKFKRYSYANMPSACDPANPLKVRDCKRPVPPALIGTSADVSLTPMVQGDAVVKTQLIAGAPTFTTFKGAASAAGATAKSKPINRFRMKLLNECFRVTCMPGSEACQRDSFREKQKSRSWLAPACVWKIRASVNSM